MVTGAAAIITAASTAQRSARAAARSSHKISRARRYHHIYSTAPSGRSRTTSRDRCAAGTLAAARSTTLRAGPETR